MPLESKARASTSDTPVSVPLAVVLPGANLVTLALLTPLPTYRLPLASNANANGPLGTVSVAVGVVLPGANSLTVVPLPPL